jgi:DNA polymerase III sliding clamp (beta) subunit (PCNA family)
MRYLLINFLRKENGQIDEMVSVSKRVRTSDLNSQNVIIDFAEQKVVKCIIEGREHPTTFELMREYYVKVYPTLVEQLEKEAKLTAIVENQKDNLKKRLK